jgi:DNA-binding response OmpR family regulator
MRLLIVEDERELAELMRRNLHLDGFAVDVVNTAHDAWTALRVETYDAVLLDINLPDGNGVKLIGEFRRANIQSPILLVSANSELQDRVSGLNSGADDYLTKPFSHEELTARIRAVLRRPGGPLGLQIKCGSLVLNTATREVSLRQTPLTLAKRELTLLEILMRRSNRVVMREAIESAVYDFGDDIGSNALEVLVSRLRKHLADAQADVAIHTVRGVGYILREAVR